MGKHILILGGTGYIGSRLYLSLTQNGHTVDTVDLEYFGNYVNRFNLKRDFYLLEPYIYKRYDVIILLAGMSSVKLSEDNLLGTFDNNVRNFVDLLLKLQPEQHLIFASSSSIYGRTDVKNVSESNRFFEATNWYDLSKAIIDNIAALTKNIRYTSLRFGTLSGYSPNLRTDILINAMMTSAKEKDKIEVYNSGIHRPVLGMRDLTRAIDVLLEHPVVNNGTFNLASFNCTVDEAANRVARVMNVPVEIKEGQPIVDDNAKLNSKAYDFSIDCTKFKTFYRFEFLDTVESICQELLDNWDTMVKSKRISFNSLK